MSRSPSQFELETLEPRLLLSADPAFALADLIGEGTGDTVAVFAELEAKPQSDETGSDSLFEVEGKPLPANPESPDAGEEGEAHAILKQPHPQDDLSLSQTAAPVVDVQAEQLVETLNAGQAPPLDGSFAQLDNHTPVPRPILIVPGIAGTFAAPGAEEAWYTQRGIAPEFLKVDPLAGYYKDIAKTLEDAAGYVLGDTLWEAAYDWRMAPGPLDSAIDGHVDGLTAENLTDDTYEFGVDYLGYWMKQAMDRWEELYGERPDSVDIITHSTGGLVARTYIQSDAYPTEGNPTGLPAVENLFLVAVPNRGAPKAWNPLHNNFASDIAYKIVLSKVMDNAYEMYLAGETIYGADGDIVRPEFGDPLSPEAFIVAYVPTVQGLLATYPFLYDGAGDLTPEDANGGQFANTWILDLNDGLDVSYTPDDFTNGTTPNGDEDPNAFADLVTGQTFVYYSDGTFSLPQGYTGSAVDPWETVTDVRFFVGPQGAGDNVTNFDEFYGHIPAADEPWYRDDTTAGAGDGTVPTDSSFGQFDADPNQLTRFATLLVDAPNITDDGEANKDSTSHTGIMSNLQMQTALLDALAIPYDASKISTDQANSHEELLAAVLSLQILDPAELLVNADWGDFAAFAVNTSIREGLAYIGGLYAEADDGIEQFLEDSGVITPDRNPLLWPLPGTDKRIGDLISFKTVFDDYIAQPILQYMLENPDGSTDGLANFINNILGSSINLTPDKTFKIKDSAAIAGLVSLSNTALQTAIGAGPDAVDVINEILIYIPFEYGQTTEVPFNLGVDAGLFGFETDPNSTISYEATLAATLVIGFDMRPGLTGNERFFFRMNELEMTASADTSALNADLNVGLLGTSITNGSLSTAAGIRLGFTDTLRDERNNITRASILSNGSSFAGAMDLQRAATPFASIDASLPISVTYDGLVGLSSPRLVISDDNIFEGITDVLPEGFGSLIDFTSLATGSIEDAFETLVVTLERMLDAPILQNTLPFVAGVPLAGLVNLTNLLDSALVEKLRNEDGSLTFTNLQEFLELVNGTMNAAGAPTTNLVATFGNAPRDNHNDAGGTYDSGAKTLTFNIGYDFGFLVEDQALDFSYDLTPLEIFIGGGDLTIDGTGEFSFDLALGMETPVASVKADTVLPVDGLLTEPVLLSILLSGGALSNGQFIEMEIVPDQANTTAANLVDDINTVLAASSLADLVQARLEDGALVIETTFSGPFPALAVLQADGLGFTTDAYDTYQPSAFADLSNLSASLAAGLSAPHFTASGRVGYVGIFVNDGSANLSLDFDIDFLPDGPQAVRDLFLQVAGDPASLLPVINLSATGSILLQGITIDGGFIADPGTGAAIGISLSANAGYPVDPTDGAQVDVTFVGDFGDMLTFEQLDFATMVQMLRDGLGVLQDLTQGDFLNQPIPFIGGSVNDLLTYAEDLALFIDDLENTAPATIQAFTEQLTFALQDLLDDAFPSQNLVPQVQVVFGPGDVLKLDFAFLASAALDLKFELDPGVNIPGLGKIIDIRGESMIEATLNAWVNFVFGIDLSNPASPTLELFEGTEAVFEIFVSAEDINFTAAAPLGFFVRGGTARIDDGTAQRGPATASFAFTPNGTDRLALGSVSFSDFSFTVTGQASADLPVRFPIDTEANELPDHITFSVNFQDLGNPTFSGPDFDQLFANLNLFDSLKDGLDLLFYAFEEVADGEIFGFEIPFIGDQLAEAATFILELREQIELVLDSATNYTENELAGLLYNALGSSKLDFLLPIGDSGLPNGLENASQSDVQVTIDGEGVNANSIEIEMRLGQLIELLNVDIAFADGLPGLNLDFDTQMLISMAWEWRLIFGVDRSTGFYIKTVGGEELTISIDASFPDTALTGSLGFIGMSAQTRPGGLGAGLDLTAKVDLLSGPTGTVALGDLASQGFSSFDVSLEGDAVLDLEVKLGFADLSGDPVDALPSFLADLFFRWQFLDGSMGGSTPELRLDNIRLDVGTFFNDFLRPIIETVAAYLEPLRPIVDFLSTDLKFISWKPVEKIFDQNGDGKVTVLDLVDLFGGNISPTAYDFLDAVVMIFDILDTFDTGRGPSRDSNLTISLGSYNFSGMDLRDMNVDEGDFFNASNFSNAGSSVESQFASIGGKVASIFAMTQTGTEDTSDDPVDPNSEIPEPGVFQFRLFQPENLIKLIMGQPVDFFYYTLPEITVDFTFSDSYVVWSPPVVKVRFGFTVGFSANLTFGYDSSGVMEYLQPDGEASDLFGGFFVAVGEGVPPQLKLFGRIYGGASVGLLVADVAVDIGAALIAEFSLIDPGEGKLYFWQIANLVKNRGLLEAIKCLFITEGEIYGFATLSVDVFFVTVFSVEIGRITFWEASGGGDPDCFNFLIPDRLEQFVDGRPNNDNRGFAADLGIAPGIHLRGASISTPGDIDYYRFELVKPEAISILLDGHPDFAITLYDAAGLVVGARGPGNDRKRINTGTLPVGEYIIGIEAPDSDAYDAYSLDITPAASSSTRVFYVNSPTADPPEVHSFYSLAPGDDSHPDAGLDPINPAATIQRILSLHNPSANDIIVYDTGIYTDSLTLSGAPAGMTLAGAPTDRFEELPDSVVFGTVLQGSGTNPGGSVHATQDLTLTRFLFANSDTGLKVTQSDNLSAVGLSFENNGLGLDLQDSDGASLTGSHFSGPGELNTGLRVVNSSGFAATGNEMTLLDTGMALINTVDANVANFVTGEVENGIVAEGGSGLTLSAITLEGAEVTETEEGTLLYEGSGATGISVSQHANLDTSDIDIRRYGTGMRLTEVSGGIVTGFYSEEADVAFRGWGLGDVTVVNSVIVSPEPSVAVFLGLPGDPSSQSNNVTITQSSLGVLPAGNVDWLPVAVSGLIQDVSNLTVNNIDLLGGLSVVNGSLLTVTDNYVLNGSLHFRDSNDLTLTGNTLQANGGGVVSRVRMESVTSALMQSNVIEKISLNEGEDVTGTLPGIGVDIVSSDDLLVKNNIITRIVTGLSISGSAESPTTNSTVELNSFTTGSTGIYLVDTFTSGLLFERNAVDDYSLEGIHAVGYAEFNLNTVENSGTGIRFEPDTPGLFSNTVRNNAIGLTGGGYLGNDDRSATRYNFVTLNITGILAEGDQQVAFNKVWENETGLLVEGDAVTAHHNLIYRNTETDVEIRGGSGTNFWNNTVYSTGTYGVHLTSGSSNTDLRNNIVYNSGGTVLAVDFPSGDGITSNYNTWYADDGAVLFEWIKTFDDILDWQIELGLDLNSLGNTRLDPSLDDPAFVDAANNDFTIVDETSRTINSGDPSFTFDNEPGPNAGPNGLRINQGAYGDTTLAALSPSSYIRVLSPNYYLDYSADVARRIVWEFFNIGGNVSLELIEDGVGKVADMTTVTIDNVPDQVVGQPASHGSYLWSPQMSGIAGDNDKRYFIRIISADNTALEDTNREPFAVLVGSNAFYVNDGSTAGDQLTTASGDNRHTGKLPSTPKAILPAILQNYSLAADQTVSVDTGDYLHLRDMVFSSVDELGDNEAFTLTGPAGDPGQVVFNRSDPREGSVGILLDDSSFVTIRNLTVTGGYRGIEARNFSTFLALDNLRITNHTGIQVHLHDGADRATLDNIELLDGAGDGLVVDALLQFLTNSRIDSHNGLGASLTDTGNTLIQGNIISDNLDGGLWVYNRVSETETVIGSEALASELGNQFVDNRGNQVYARGNALVAGNAIYHTEGGTSAGEGFGIYLWDVDARYNVVASHATGIYTRTASTIEGNRIYDNTIRGIGLHSNGGLVLENVIYSSAAGIEELVGQRIGGATIRNNLIYDFWNSAFKTTNSNGYVFENNTIYSLMGDGLVIRGSSGGTVVNNVFHLEGGTAIDLDFASQVSLASDYNIFDMAGNGVVGTWAGGGRTTLQDWRNAAFIDGNSLAIDPLFVDVNGVDGILGFDSSGNDGRDDNFHLQSTSGSIRNGSLTPVLDMVSGLPVFLESTRVADASQSPGIDRGDATYAFDQEPAPNGNFINIGAFGNTDLASLSPVAYVLVTSPNGGETWPIEQTFAIEWRSQNFDGSVDIFLMQEGVVDPVATIASATANDGSFDWTLTNSLTPAENYRIEVVRNDAPDISGQSLDVFAVSEPISFYYVNDEVVDVNGYTTGIGDNANDGLSPATPKASIRAILDAYDLGEGDVVLVDAGTYDVTTNIFIEVEDSQATIRGFNDPSRPELLTVLDRGNRASGSYVFELTGVDGLTVEWITFTNAYRGIYADDDQAPNLTIRENRFIHNEDAGLMLESGNRGFLAEGNYFEGSGVVSGGNGRQTSGIDYKGWDAVIRGNSFVSNYGEAILLDPANTSEPVAFLIEGNTIDAFRNGMRFGSYVKDALVQDNTVFNSEVDAIDARGPRTIITNNTVYDNNVGISVIFGATAIENVEVYNNVTGISVGRDSSAIRNTVYGNTRGIYGNNAGAFEDNVAYNNGTGIIWNHSTIVVGNIAYGNERGMHADGYIGSNSQWRTSMFNNLSYGNTEYALLVERTVGSPQVTNNTFIQAGEDSTAVILDLAPNVRFTNNIVAIDAGQAMHVSISSQPDFTADYNLYHLTGGAAGFLWGELPLDTQLDWFYNVGADAHSLFTDPLFIDPASSNYHLSTGSPAIDAGTPDSHYQLEPEPAGGRINLGAYGNTGEASVSPARSIQVLNPVGLDKLLEGQLSTTDFLVAGFLDAQHVAWYNAGNDTVGSWIQLPGASGVTTDNISSSTAIDLSNVTDPAPEDVYHLNWRTNFGVGERMDLVLDLLPGDYRLRLHFIDTATSDSEIFDVEVNGVLVLDDYSVFAAAGGRYIAVVEEVEVTVGEDGKATVTITSGNRYGRISAIEALRLYPDGTADPTFNVAVTFDNGANLTSLASGVSLDTRGIGTLEWTPFTHTDGRTAQLTVASESLPSITGESETFLVANSGSIYYVNDSSPANDVHTTAIGNNANSGKSPDSPMASLEALLTVYSPLPGDTIFIDTGTYNLTRNIVLGAEDSGITIMGAFDSENAAVETIFDRGNQANGAYGIELQGAEGVTIEYLTITNADDGIHAQTAGAVNLTILNSRFLLNGDNGIFIDRENPGFLAENNYFEGDGTHNVDPQDTGLYYGSTHAVIRNNVFVDNYQNGIDVDSPSPHIEMDYLIEGNTVSGSRTGIRADGWVNDAIVRHNTVFNTSTAAMIISGGRSLVTANTIYDNNVGVELRGALATGNTEIYGNTIGIHAGTGSRAIGNIVYNNSEGIRVNGSGFILVQDNISYNNTDFGYRFNHNSRIIGNVAYGNRGGFYADDLGSNSQFRGIMHNNLSYGNSEYALYMERIVGSPKVFSNTFVQEGAAATAVILDNAPNVYFQNNIISASGATALSVTANSQAGFDANYNVWDIEASITPFIWGDRIFMDQSEWYYNTSRDEHSVFANPVFMDPAGGDYHLQAGSPAIDAGDPEWGYAAEPIPAGGRLNAGAYGNTPEAATSPARTITVLDPTFLAKPVQNSQTGIRFHTSGFLREQSVAWFNAGDDYIGGWLPLEQMSTGGAALERVTVVNTDGVLNPAPQAVYHQYLRSSFGIGSRMDVPLELNPGDYRLRLHFAMVNSSNAGFMDIEVDGAVVVENYDIDLAAGGTGIAVVEELPVTIDASGRITISFVAKENYAYLNAIEVVRVDESLAPEIRFTIESSFDRGESFTDVATSIVVDSRGMATVPWTPEASTTGLDAVIRVTSESPVPASGLSSPFLVANDGNRFYVNDGALDNDLFTTAIGNNLNSGKSPNSPMASLEALFLVHTPKAGDIVYVDAGTYLMNRNILLTEVNSGITIIGATDPDTGSSTAILDRDNLNSPSYVFEIDGADDLVLDSLSITNGYRGIMVYEGQGINLTIRNSRITFNQHTGVFIEGSNPGLIVEDSHFEGRPEFNVPNWQEVGIAVYSTNLIVRNSTFINHYRGGLNIENSREANPQALVIDSIFDGGGSGNGMLNVNEDYTTVLRSVFANGRYDGIYLQGANSIVRESVAYGNADEGFNIRNAATAQNNVAYDNGRGFFGNIDSKLLNNVSYGNTNGIFTNQGLAKGNRVYGNTGYGIGGYLDAQIIGNHVYSNDIGIRGFPVLSGFNLRPFEGRISDNLVYDHGTTGIHFERGDALTQIINNTVFQPAGNALYVRETSSALIRNNILWVDAGFGINIDGVSLVDAVEIDYNLFNLSPDPNARIGEVDEVFADTLAEWQLLSGKDAASLLGDPLFFDVSGADDIFAYREIDTILIDGGEDDNYHIQKLSPAIDTGFTWWSSKEDLEEDARLDDPGVANTGGDRYVIDASGESLFDTDRGIAQGWTNRWTKYTFDLPFSFTFFGESHTQIQVSTYGMIAFPSSTVSITDHDVPTLIGRPLLAPFWAEVTTDGGNGRDIFVDTSVSDEVYIRWEARDIETSATVQFAILLKSDGSIRFDYGQVVAGLDPVVGLSFGNGIDYHLVDGYYGADDLTGAASVTITRQAGITDIGAYEFKGNSLDAQAPVTIGTQPLAVESAGTFSGFLESIVVQLSEAIDTIDVSSPATYELILDSDLDGQFTDADTFYEMIPVHDPDTNTVTLVIFRGPLEDGNYQFRISAGNLRDVSGNPLDGDGDGNAGGDYLRTFTVRQPVLPEITNDTTAETIAYESFNFQVTATESPFLFEATGLPEGLTIETGTGLISGIPVVAGTFEVILSATNGDGVTEMTLTLDVIPVPQVLDVIVNDGDPQRSKVIRIEILIDGDISGSLAAGDIRFRDLGTDTLVAPESVQVNWSFITRTITVTFPGLQGGSLPDGDYQMEILSGALSVNGVDLDGDGDGAQGGLFQFGFHRLYGDTSGNRTVDTQDGYLFRAGYNTSIGEPGYASGLDYGGDGTIDALDRILFEENFRTSLDSTPAELAAIEDAVSPTTREASVGAVSVRFWDPSGLFRSGDRLFSTGRSSPVGGILHGSIQWAMPEDPLWESLYDNEEEEWLF